MTLLEVKVLTFKDAIQVGIFIFETENRLSNKEIDSGRNKYLSGIMLDETNNIVVKDLFGDNRLRFTLEIHITKLIVLEREVQTAIQTTEPYGIPAEIIKVLSDSEMKLFTKLFNNIYNIEVTPVSTFITVKNQKYENMS
ncbi:hypothetical protein FQA39_LY11710 [Lamprigera yunnana]|nr:hypothetical protein FQA39_LY11710 [Lamprigera yunnana]